MSNEIFYNTVIEKLKEIDDIELTTTVTAAALSELLYELHDDTGFVSDCFPDDRDLEEVEDACCLLMEYFGVYGKDWGDVG